MINIILSYLMTNMINMEYSQLSRLEINNIIYIGKQRISSMFLTKGLLDSYIGNFKICNNKLCDTCNFSMYSNNYVYYSVL